MQFIQTLKWQSPTIYCLAVKQLDKIIMCTITYRNICYHNILCTLSTWCRKWVSLICFALRLTLELHPSKNPFVKWKSFSSSAALYNFPFLYRAPSVAVKRPPACSIGPIVLMFPGHICQASLVSCHSDLSNYFPI